MLYRTFWCTLAAEWQHCSQQSAPLALQLTIHGLYMNVKQYRGLGVG